MQLPASVALLHCVQQCYAVSRCCTRVGSNILVEDMWCVCAHVRARVCVCVNTGTLFKPRSIPYIALPVDVWFVAIFTLAPFFHCLLLALCSLLLALARAKV